MPFRFLWATLYNKMLFTNIYPFFFFYRAVEVWLSHPRIGSRTFALWRILRVTAMENARIRTMCVNQHHCNTEENACASLCDVITSTAHTSMIINDYNSFSWSECEDLESECSYWASIGACWSDPGYILPSCQVSCDQCENPPTSEEQTHNGIASVCLSFRLLVFGCCCCFCLFVWVVAN